LANAMTKSEILYKKPLGYMGWRQRKQRKRYGVFKIPKHGYSLNKYST
jgi:hypothetical protein